MVTSILEMLRNPNISYADIHNELKLCSYENLQSQLNPKEADLSERPLYLAIKNGREDLVELLLHFDAKIDKEILDTILRDTNMSRDKLADIRAYLELYSYLQHQDLEGIWELGRTLKLMEECAEKIAGYNSQNPAVLIVGKTGAGKSSLVNALSGVTYERVRRRGREYLQRVEASRSEITTTNSGYVSETLFPFVFSAEQLDFVDMPGFDDTRGQAVNTVTGIGLQYLSNMSRHLKSIVHVIPYAEIGNSRGVNLLPSLNMLGRIVDEQNACIDNILLLINRFNDNTLTAEDVLEEFRIMAEENRSLPPETKNLLSKITERQIFLMDFPTPESLMELRRHIEYLPPQEFSEFNFSHFHTEAEKFKEVINRIREYKDEVDKKIFALRIAISKQALSSIHFNIPEQPVLEATRLSSKLSNEVHKANDIVYRLNELCARFTDVFANVKSKLASQEQAIGSVKMLGSDMELDLEICLRQKYILQKMLEHINKIAPEFNMKQPLVAGEEAQRMAYGM